MTNYKCYIGVCESHCYTIPAPTLRALKKILAEKFEVSGRWYQRRPKTGYPTGSKRFTITSHMSNFKVKEFVLIISS